MEYESKLSDIIASLPEVAGGFLYSPDTGIYSNQTIDIASDDSLQQVGMKLTKIISMLSVHFNDTNSIRVNFKDLVLFGTVIHNEHWLFLLHQPSLSPGMLKMTVQMALNIEPETFEPDQITEEVSTSDTEPEATETSTENIMEILLAPESELNIPLITIQEQLAQHIGPVAGLVFNDSVETWATQNSPSIDNLPELLSMLEGEIDDEEEKKIFRISLKSIGEE